MKKLSIWRSNEYSTIEAAEIDGAIYESIIEDVSESQINSILKLVGNCISFDANLLDFKLEDLSV